MIHKLENEKSVDINSNTQVLVPVGYAYKESYEGKWVFDKFLVTCYPFYKGYCMR